MLVKEKAAPHSSSGIVAFHHTCFAMNTRFSMVLVGIDRERAQALAAAAERDLQAYEGLMSRFDPASPVSDLNRRAAQCAVALPEQLWEVLDQCRHFWKQTRGAFDITLWPLQHLWRECLKHDEEPSAEAIEQALQHTGFDRLDFDATQRTLRFQRDGTSIDLGGIGKGFALERLAGSLRQQGVEQAFLSFGESSITVIGAHPRGPAWPVGIANMFRPSEPVHTFDLKDASLSSSGTMPSTRLGGTRMFGHILDPYMGRPIVGYRTMSVTSKSGIEAEVLSTALLVTPEPDRAPILAGFSNISAIEIVYQSNADLAPHIQWEYGL